ncbi:class I SAM-dependent methyltransferase [Sphingomonas montanisoli]|uniref:Class I SAM-dependent methyltransferase n=1 Tax=Sphingomonas montanisoli TaxID=2606412 RepID=A0A5D9C290_9SPHN|nr:class I SAM-dependent methyltransferase [Sphingomonas montanisoli]TZG24121.1 class I SAM-dependent methyltransferase [Sphingomonas montanisoli]
MNEQMHKDEVAQAVESAYFWILGRQADPGGLDHHVARILRGETDYRGLREGMLSSDELKGKGAALGRAIYERDNPIETDCSQELLATMLTRIQQSWTTLGKEAAHWSVITGNEFTPENIEANLDNFYQSGSTLCHMIDCTLRRVGIDPSQLATVIDYGCGVGRITLNLAERYDAVIGVDISPEHLRLACQRAEQTSASNAEFRQILKIEDISTLPEAHLIVSFIVLQHNPPPVALSILASLLDRLRPSGVAIFQIPTFIEGYRFDPAIYMATEQPLMEIHAIPQHVLFRRFAASGCEVLEVREDMAIADMPAISQTFVVRKSRLD